MRLALVPNAQEHGGITTTNPVLFLDAQDGEWSVLSADGMVLSDQIAEQSSDPLVAKLGSIAVELNRTVPTCDWLILVASGNPEPDSYADTVKEVPCGATVSVHPDCDEGTMCTAGHERLPIEYSLAPYGPEWQREQAERYGF